MIIIIITTTTTTTTIIIIIIIIVIVVVLVIIMQIALSPIYKSSEVCIDGFLISKYQAYSSS